MIFKKAKTKRKKFYNKEKTAKSRTWTIRTEGSTPRPLRHAAKHGAFCFVSSERVSVSACRFTVFFFFCFIA